MNKNQENKTSVTRVIIYLLLSLIYGIIFFTITIVGITLGVGTLIIWVGIPVLASTFAMLHGIAAIERSQIRDMLNIHIPAPVTSTNTQHMNWMQRQLALIRNPLSWKIMFYTLLIKLPMGIITFTLTIALLAIVLAFLLAPLGYIIPTAILGSMGIETNLNDGPNWLWLNIIQMLTPQITGHFEVFELIKSCILVPVGILLWVPIRLAILGIGRVSGEIARAMLGPIEDTNVHAYDQHTTRQYQNPAQMQ